MLCCGLLAACSSAPETVRPGRGAEAETGPMEKVYPSGEASRIDRHGLWRGMDGERVVWEVRYTRGVPTGPYRQWNEDGEMIATWPYNWDGEIEGWARWFDEGEMDGKIEITEENRPSFDAIGKASALKDWMRDQDSKD